MRPKTLVEKQTRPRPQADKVVGTHNGSSPQILLRAWTELCARHLPVAPADSVWRFSRSRAPADLAQGWKLHVSATLLAAGEVLARIAPYLTRRGLMFKAPGCLTEVSNINCGLFYGYSQVGKLITVYPQSAAEAVGLARRLHQLTRGQPAPAVPFDVRYRPDSCVFYRYGAFDALTVEQPDGTHVPALRAPAGNLIPDCRAPGAAVPSWTTDPFPKRRAARTQAAQTNSPLGTSIFAYKALAQRGKGGVYQAFDISARPTARFCVLKEGRRHGETDWDGRDGYWRVRHERRVLDALTHAAVPVPTVYTSFAAQENYYVVTEYIAGQNLQEIIAAAPQPLPLGRACRYGLLLAELLDKIHRAGWVWRDCKPANLMLSEDGRMRPLDFEGAHSLDAPEPMPWGTLGYVPPEWYAGTDPHAPTAQDLYALGAVLHQLCCGRVPESSADMEQRRNLPPVLNSLVGSLLDPCPAARPTARAVADTLRSALAAASGGLGEALPVTFSAARVSPYHESAGGDC